MAIRWFNVQGMRGLRRAEARDLPNLVAISGPNGAGKSSLLELIKAQRGSFLEPGTELMYVGPHRTWRSAPVNEVAILGLPMEYGNILMQDIMPSLQYAIGNFNNFSGLSRQGSGGDDAQAYVKASIIRIRNKQRRILNQQWEEQGRQVAPGSVPDLFEPFAELVATLLPHLTWVGVNDSDQNNIRCEFKGSRTEAFDIDELSSGEKAAIALFLPFIEREVAAREAAATSGQQASTPTDGVVPLTLLLDEPELHLHPLLQLNVLEYMRTIAREDRAQFILTVHSPSLLDALTKDELFLLAPADLAADNQLSRLVDSNERLEAVRAMTGATHMLTRCKPIVFVEGEANDGAKATDERITKILLPEVQHWALVPSKGKAEVVKAASEMRHTQIHLPGMPMFGLVDNDQGAAKLPDFVVAWPVAMLENLLLDADALYEVVEPYEGVVGIKSADAVERSLYEVAGESMENERRLRLKGLLPRETLSVDTSDFAVAETNVHEAAEKYLAALKKIDLVKLQSQVEADVQGIVDRKEQLERFHGKNLLRAWYDKHFSKVGIGWNPFLIEVARHASGKPRLQRLAMPAVNRIRLYFPEGLVEALSGCEAGPVRDELLSECESERRNWEEGHPVGAGRELLRRRLVQYVHEQGTLGEEAKSKLLQAAMAIGTL